MRCSTGGGHMAPIENFSISDRGVMLKTCSVCRADNRAYKAKYGDPKCEHNKRRTRCLTCNPASAFGYYTSRRAQHVLGTKLPVSTTQLLGCSSQIFAGYIIAKFRDGMALENHGRVWHLDHIIPIAQRDADGNRPDQATIISRFHFTNVQPILIAEHQAKTIAEKVALFMPPILPAPVHLTDEEFDELMTALNITV
jgi:hypothetical protein